MKLRTGFVSNSSSSSFLVGHDPGKPFQAALDLTQFIDWSCSTEEELRNQFDYDYGDDFLEDEKLRPKYEASLAEIRQGKTVYSLRVERDFYDIMHDALHSGNAPTLLTDDGD